MNDKKIMDIDLVKMEKKDRKDMKKIMSLLKEVRRK